MILIAGRPDEPPVARAIDAAEAMGVAHAVLPQEGLGACRLQLSLVPGAGWTGWLSLPDRRIDLETVTGVYLRLVGGTADPVQDLFLEWCNLAPIRVANPPAAMASNMSKTYQAGLIRAAGLSIPETLVTTDPAAALAFVDSCAAEGDGVIYKSVSGIRSIVQRFTPGDAARLGRIRWCPTQFQRRVEGIDTRVHVIGRELFATRIESGATDYRYAAQQTGDDASLAETELPPAIAAQCLALAAALGLPFTGIDLRLAPDGRAVCFEANPCPAYSYYEAHTGAPIAEALLRWLAGLSR